MKNIEYKMKEITLYNKTKYQIVFGSGEKHLAYLNSKQEAQEVVRHLNQK